jgi:uncharacterized membrane protein
VTELQSHDPMGRQPAAVRAVTSARTKLLVALGGAIAGGAAAALAGPASAEADAKREDPSRDIADLVVLGAAIASLIAVGVVLFGAGRGQREREVPGRRSRPRLRIRVLDSRPHGVHLEIRAALLFGRFGRNQLQRHSAPDYRDFAYLAFTIGMTFQVSDTNIQSRDIRQTVLRHAWLSFPLVAVIIATSINLVSGLAN